MKICPVAAKLFHADGLTGRQTDKWTDRCNKANESLFTILHTHL